YFTTGGRRTQSGLYRVNWAGAPITKSARTEKRQQAADLEIGAPPRGTNLWLRLDSSDKWLRHAARIELEAKPVNEWSARALTESRPTAALTALIALSRTGERSLQPKIISRLDELSAANLDAERQLIAVRAFGVCFIRMGRP